MDYVCKVIGELSIEDKDFKLRMSFNEIIDLSPDDFKVSPRLRVALRNREIEVYTPTLHKKARRLKARRKMELLRENILPLKKPSPAKASAEISNTAINEMKIILGSISNKMNGVVSRLDILVTKVIESNNTLNANFTKFFSEKQNIQVSYNNDKLDSLLNSVVLTQNKFNNYIIDQTLCADQIKEEKLDKLLDSIEKLLTEGIKLDGKNLNIQNTNGGGYSNIRTENSVQSMDDDIPIFVPKIKTDVSNKNIVTKEIKSEGTENILEKLKNLK